MDLNNPERSDEPAGGGIPLPRLRLHGNVGDGGSSITSSADGVRAAATRSRRNMQIDHYERRRAILFVPAAVAVAGGGGERGFSGTIFRTRCHGDGTWFECDYDGDGASVFILRKDYFDGTRVTRTKHCRPRIARARARACVCGTHS